MEEDDFIVGFCGSGGTPGRRWEQRLTDSCGLLFSLEGAGVIGIGKEQVRIGENELALLKPQFRHTFSVPERWIYFWCHFVPRAHVTGALKWKDEISGLGRTVLSAEASRRVREALEEIRELELHRPAGWFDLSMLLLESVLVRGFNHQRRSAPEPEPGIELAKRLLLLDTSESMDALAVRCGMSRAALYAKFKRETGVSPRQYRECAQLRRAANLLERADFSISEIAAMTGMPDPYYFSARFRKFSGLSPRDYRKRSRREK